MIKRNFDILKILFGLGYDASLLKGKFESPSYMLELRKTNQTSLSDYNLGDVKQPAVVHFYIKQDSNYANYNLIRAFMQTMLIEALNKQSDLQKATVLNIKKFSQKHSEKCKNVLNLVSNQTEFLTDVNKLFKYATKNDELFNQRVEKNIDKVNDMFRVAVKQPEQLIFVDEFMYGLRGCPTPVAEVKTQSPKQTK